MKRAILFGRLLTTHKCKLTQLVKTFHRDEQGDVTVEKVVNLAVIALPTIYIVLQFKEQLIQYFGERVKEIFPDSDGPQADANQ